jgi:hypothetical protein
VLLTEPALAQARMDPSSPGMQRHVLRYPHFGAIACFVGDGVALRREATAMALGA